MGVRVAYGSRDRLMPAIEKGIIPKDTIVITKDDAESEMLFYDADGNLKSIEERSRFESLTEAEQWVQKYPCAGSVLVVHRGDEWVPYIVQNDNSLTPIDGESGDVADVRRIDGGSAIGI